MFCWCLSENPFGFTSTKILHWGPANIYLIIMVVWQLHNQITYPNIHSSWRQNALPPLGEGNEKFVDIALAHIKYTLSAWLVVVYFSKRFLAIELINGHKYSLYSRNAYILIYMGQAQSFFSFYCRIFFSSCISLSFEKP